jgi:hypothetical protein
VHAAAEARAHAPLADRCRQDDADRLLDILLAAREGNAAARLGDTIMPCANSTPPGTGSIIGPGIPTVIIGG